MTKTADMRLLLAAIFTAWALAGHAQLRQVSIVRPPGATKKMQASARVQQLNPMTLPFWDDFSFNNPKQIDSLENYASDSLWQYGRAAWVNTGMAINPPTYKVATFDGIDSVGLPYNLNTPLAKGVADRMVSRPIRMDLVDPAKRDSVFFQFYYQWQGNGEPPDPGDNLSVWFKNDSSRWINVWTSADTLKTFSKFFLARIPFSDAHYFHSNFQFRIQNFGRLSGPFDTWHIDYVYINNGEREYAPQYADFPDRAIAMPLSSAFVQYQSIPAKHFLAHPDSLLTYPSLPVTNQRRDQTIAANYPQPVNLVTHLTTTTRLNKAVSAATILLDSLPAQTVFHDVPTIFTLNKKPSFAAVDPKTDSIALKFSVQLHTGDNKKKINVNVGDFDTLVYKGIEFRYNDSTSRTFVLRNYYAYDDGRAEYAVTLTQPGSSLAYQFDLAYARPDTLIGVDIYFPHVGDESNQVIRLQVLDSLSGTSLDTTSARSPWILKQLNLTVVRTANDKFSRILFDSALLVKRKFYIGWVQNTSATIGVGYDKNSSSASKIFYNTSGVWQQNTVLQGNLMIRPLFGNKLISKIITGIDEMPFHAYPNPNRGQFYLAPAAQGMQVMDVTGRAVTFAAQRLPDRTQLTMDSALPGLYVVRYYDGVRWRAEKIMVLP